MAQLEAVLKEFSLVLERKDLEGIFSRIGAEQDWHRLEERISQLKKICRPLGVDLILRRDRLDLRVCFSTPEGLHSAIRELTVRRGHIQKAFALALQSKSAVVIDRRALGLSVPEADRTPWCRTEPHSPNGLADQVSHASIRTRGHLVKRIEFLGPKIDLRLDHGCQFTC